MATLVYMALCRHAVIDRESNSASLFDLIEELSVPPELLERSLEEKVATGMSMDLLALISREWPTPAKPEGLTVELRLRFPSGEYESLSEAKPDLTTAPRSRVIFKLQALSLRGAGMYELELLTGDEVMGKAPLLVRAAPPAP